jgi:hypothetical protein
VQFAQIGGGEAKQVRINGPPGSELHDEKSYAQGVTVMGDVLI